MSSHKHVCRMCETCDAVRVRGRAGDTGRKKRGGEGERKGRESGERGGGGGGEREIYEERRRSNYLCKMKVHNVYWLIPLWKLA